MIIRETINLYGKDSTIQLVHFDIENVLLEHVVYLVYIKCQQYIGGVMASLLASIGLNQRL